MYIKIKQMNTILKFSSSLVFIASYIYSVILYKKLLDTSKRMFKEFNSSDNSELYYIKIQFNNKIESMWLLKILISCIIVYIDIIKEILFLKSNFLHIIIIKTIVKFISNLGLNILLFTLFFYTVREQKKINSLFSDIEDISVENVENKEKFIKNDKYEQYKNMFKKIRLLDILIIVLGVLRTISHFRLSY